MLTDEEKKEKKTGFGQLRYSLSYDPGATFGTVQKILVSTTDYRSGEL